MSVIRSKDSIHEKAKARLPQTIPFSAVLSPTVLKPPPGLSLALRSSTHAAPLRMKPLVQPASDTDRAWGEGTSESLWPTLLPHPGSAPSYSEGLREAPDPGLPILGLGSRSQGRLVRGCRVPGISGCGGRVPGTRLLLGASL